jgi:hypothetical protein
MSDRGPTPEEAGFRPPTGSWGRLYALVVVALVVEVVLLTALSRAFP